MQRRVRWGCVIVAVTVATARAAVADPSPPALATPPFQMPEVVVQGRTDPDMASDAPLVSASAGTVSGDDLQDLPVLRRGELLEAVPGMVVTQHSGDGKANQYFLRGFNLDHGTDFASPSTACR